MRKQLAIDLTKHGCPPNKSLNLSFPKINKSLLHHFMRGYFDGDGTLTTYNNGKSLKFGVVGTKDFLDIYEGHLYKIGITKTKYQPTGKSWQTQHGGNQQAKIFFDFLYKDATVYLDRKYNKFTAVLGGNT